MDHLLQDKIQLKHTELQKQYADESKKRLRDAAARGAYRSGSYHQVTVEAMASQLIEYTNAYLDIIKEHQELRQSPFNFEEIEQIKQYLIDRIDGQKRDYLRGLRSLIASHRMNDTKGYLASLESRLNSSEPISIIRIRLEELKFFKPRQDPQVLINIVNNINIDMDAIFSSIIENIEAMKLDEEKEKKSIITKLKDLRNSTIVKEIGKTVIIETIKKAIA